VVRPRTIAAFAVKPVLPYATLPFAIPKYATPKSAVDKETRTEQTAHHNSTFKYAAVPIAFEKNGSPINCLASKNLAVIKFTLL